MAKETLTFALEGDITLDSFAAALGEFNALVKQLSKEASGDAQIDWFVEELYSGSAIATFHGVHQDIRFVENVVVAYEQVGYALSSGTEIPFSENVKKRAYNIANMLNGKVSSVRFETQERDFIVTGKVLTGEKSLPMKYSLGSVKGVVETLSRRKGLSFTLWDALFDKPVTCYLDIKSEEKMRNAWGKQAIVSGRVGRQPLTGKPVVIRDVKNIQILKEPEPGSYKRVRGVLPWQSGDEKPEMLLRRLRDA